MRRPVLLAAAEKQIEPYPAATGYNSGGGREFAAAVKYLAGLAGQKVLNSGLGSKGEFTSGKARTPVYIPPPINRGNMQ